MKTRLNKKAVGKYIWNLLIFFTIGVFMSSFSAEAASNKVKAKKAYSKFLANYKRNPEFREIAKNEFTKKDFSFALCDVSGDGIPELFLREICVEPYEYWIYTYHNGKVKKLKRMDYFMNGVPYIIYPKTHIVCASEGDSYSADNIFYKISKGKIKVIARTKTNYEEVPGEMPIVRGKTYYIKGKKVSKSRYKKYVAKLKKGKKISEENKKLKFRVNNAKNRKKFLAVPQAKTKAKLSLRKAYKAYVKKHFKAKKYAYKYPNAECILYDINKDGTKEMIVRYESGVRNAYQVFTYKKGKVKKLHKGEFFGAGSICYIKGKKVLVISFSNGASDGEHRMYKIKGNKLKMVKRYRHTFNENTRKATYYSGKNKISRAQYDRFMNKLKPIPERTL